MAIPVENLITARNGKPLWEASLDTTGTPSQTTQTSEPNADERRRRLQRRASLGPEQRRALLEVLERLLGGAYAHLPLKRARYGFDPVHRVRILRTQSDDMDDAQFRAQVNDIIVQLRDLHTFVDWVGRGKDVAFLPFAVESYSDQGVPRYVVTQVLLPPITARPQGCAPGPPEPTPQSFLAGVEIEYWNALPIDVAVRRHGEQFAAGGRDDSRRALAVTSLTHRPLRYYEPPDEDWVDIGYRQVDARGQRGTLRWARFFWHTLNTDSVDRLRKAADERAAAARGETPKKGCTTRRSINVVAAEIGKAKALRYATAALQGGRPEPTATRGRGGPGTQLDVLDTKLGSLLRASVLQGIGGSEGRHYGYLRIFSFDTDDPAGFVAEVERLLRLLPQNGLIVDVRDNSGGTINAAEWMLQLLTPNPIEPVRFSVLATDFARGYCQARRNREEYDGWLPSLRASVRSGELYSSAEPISSPEDCNDRGQAYGGPVMLVANANTYSSGDLFCAGFIDNAIGRYCSVDNSTGAGGACVVDFAELLRGARRSDVELPALPEGVDLNISFLRATRSRGHLGAAIEDVGVPPTERVLPLTRRDLLENNCDLLARCVRKLAKEPLTSMTVARPDRGARLIVETTGIDRVDVRLDDHALESKAPGRGGRLVVQLPRGTRRIEVSGFADGELRQRRLLGRRR